jgi:hypothetical protein
MVGVNSGVPGFEWGQAEVEFNIRNRFSLSISPAVRLAGGLGEALRAQVDLEYYPLASKDMGLPGFPYDRRDLGHEFAPFLAVGGGAAFLLPEDESFSGNSVALQSHLKVGARWYPFRTFIVSTRHTLDDVFVEIPLGYELNISSYTGAFGYDSTNDDVLGRGSGFLGVPNLYTGIWAGIIL